MYADRATELHLFVDERLHTLTQELHSKIDAAFDVPATLDVASAGPRSIKPGRTEGKWSYVWPAGSAEHFESAHWYDVQTPSGSRELKLGWTNREAWGRDRRRAIVFVQSGRSLYPLTEFVETDTGAYAAPIPDPARPRAILTDLERLPAHLSRRSERVHRTDEAFDSVRNAPSLRYEVDGDEQMAMIEHACWVGTVRHRF
jgi:hypothetical protein